MVPRSRPRAFSGRSDADSACRQRLRAPEAAMAVAEALPAPATPAAGAARSRSATAARSSAILLLAPAVLFFVVVFVIPVGLMIRYSFYQQTTTGDLHRPATLANYVRLASVDLYRTVVMTTLRVSAVDHRHRDAARLSAGARDGARAPAGRPRADRDRARAAADQRGGAHLCVARDPGQRRERRAQLDAGAFRARAGATALHRMGRHHRLGARVPADDGAAALGRARQDQSGGRGSRAHARRHPRGRYSAA